MTDPHFEVAHDRVDELRPANFILPPAHLRPARQSRRLELHEKLTRVSATSLGSNRRQICDALSARMGACSIPPALASLNPECAGLTTLCEMDFPNWHPARNQPTSPPAVERPRRPRLRGRHQGSRGSDETEAVPDRVHDSELIQG